MGATIALAFVFLIVKVLRVQDQFDPRPHALARQLLRRLLHHDRPARPHIIGGIIVNSYLLGPGTKSGEGIPSTSQPRRGTPGLWHFVDGLTGSPLSPRSTSSEVPMDAAQHEDVSKHMGQYYVVFVAMLC